MKKDVKFWQTTIKQARDFKEKISAGRDNRTWDNYLDYFRSKFANESELTYNMIFGILKALLPRVYYENPRVTVRPAINNVAMANPQYLIFSQILENIDNWLLSDIMLNLKNDIKLVIQDSFIYNFGVLKIGYDTEFVLPFVMSSLHDATLNKYNLKTGHRIEYDTNIRSGMPFIKRIDPRDIVVPPDCLSLSNCRWIAHRTKRLLEDVESDERLDSIKTIPIIPDKNQPETFIDLWEIHDYKTGKLYIISDHSDKFLFNGIDTLQIIGLPFEELVFNPDGDNIWGVSDVKIILPQQKELNEVRLQELQFRRLQRLKFLVEKGSIKQEELDKILSEEGTVFIQTDGNPLTVIKELPIGIPSNLEQWAQLIREDVRELVGFSRVQLGEFEQTGRRTAFETAQVGASSNIRCNERGSLVGDLLSKAFRKVHSYIFKFWESERIAEIIGTDGVKYWVAYKGKELEGDYVVSINIENAQLESSVLRKQEAKELFTTLIRDPELTTLARQKLREHLLRQYNWTSSEMIDVTTGMPAQTNTQVMPLKTFTNKMMNLSSG